MREEEKELPINADNDNCNLGGDHNTKKEMRLLCRLTEAVPSHKNLWGQIIGRKRNQGPRCTLEGEAPDEQIAQFIQSQSSPLMIALLVSLVISVT